MPVGSCFWRGCQAGIGLRERHAPFKREGRCRPRCHLPVSGQGDTVLPGITLWARIQIGSDIPCFSVVLAHGVRFGAIGPAASVSEPSPSLPPILASPVVTAPCAVFGRPHLPTGFAAPNPSHREHPSQLVLRGRSRSGAQSPRPNRGCRRDRKRPRRNI